MVEKKGFGKYKDGMVIQHVKHGRTRVFCRKWLGKGQLMKQLRLMLLLCSLSVSLGMAG